MYSVHIFTESTWVCWVKCHSGYASTLHPLPPAHWSSAQQHLVYMEQLARRKKYMEPAAESNTWYAWNSETAYVQLQKNTSGILYQI